MRVAKQNLTLFFPTPVWNVEMEGYEPVNQAIREELARIDWQSVDEQHAEMFSEYHTYSEDRFITVEQAPTIGVILELFMDLCKQIGKELNWDLSEHRLVLSSYWVHATQPGDLTQTQIDIEKTEQRATDNCSHHPHSQIVDAAEALPAALDQHAGDRACQHPDEDPDHDLTDGDSHIYSPVEDSAARDDCDPPASSSSLLRRVARGLP